MVLMFGKISPLEVHLTSLLLPFKFSVLWSQKRGVLYHQLQWMEHLLCANLCDL